MPDPVRPVWLHHETCREIYFALQESATTETLDAFRRAWVAAPADATEAVYPLISPHTYMSWPADGRPKPGQDTARSVTAAVLLALGYPRTEQA